MKQTTPTQRIARAMVYARRKTYIPTVHLAKMLNIDAATLKRYESGKEDVPAEMLERLFTFGYMMLHTRHLNNNFCHIARILFKYGISQSTRPRK